ncbi:MAG: TerD family protein [Myxococcales bacterium]|nr:TerD family protein [Myxococcales bacterium]
MHPLNSLYLRRKRKVIVPAGADALPLGYVATALKNLERLGFTCSPPLLARLRTLSERDLAATYGQLVSTLRKLKGADVAWQPMYPNFPRQVMEAADAELYVNALMHYLGDWVGLRIMPVYPVADRPPLIEAVELEVLDLGDDAELRAIARNLIGAATSISAQDQDDLRALLIHYGADLTEVLPPEIPHKENLAFTAGVLLEHKVASDVLLTRYFRTATDVLRLAVARSDGDVSLAAPTKFRSFARAERRLLVALVDRLAAPDEDLWRHREAWLRLGERLHPGELADRYPKAGAAFARLRAGERPATFNRQVEHALRTPDVARALARLRTRPGELARRLDHLLRLATPAQQPAVLDAFTTAAGEVSTPVLLQVLTHFEHRGAPEAVRPIFPKGDAAKVVTVPNTLPPLPPAVTAAVVVACEGALRTRFARLAPLGKVYVDPQLATYLVPSSQRSASKALRTLVRGSRIPLPAGGTLRFFLWWKEGLVEGKPTGRVDIDLSAALYDDAFTYREHISWTNLRSGKLHGAHSGDITSAPDGACEFIDLDLASVRDYGVRYIVASAFAFTSQPFCNLPECFVGWMMRTEPASGEIFEPATVVDRVDLAADQRIAIPAIIDVVTREVIWTDVAHRQPPQWTATVERNRSSLGQLVQAMTVLHKTSLHRLWGLHADARGTRVDTAAEADTVFSVETGTTPRDLEVIMAEYLA